MRQFGSDYFVQLLACEAVLSKFLLPPANEVWDKVMFLPMSVILFLRGSVRCHFLSGCLVPCSFWGLCLWSHVPSRGSLLGGLSLSRGISVWGSLSGGGGLCQGEPRTETSKQIPLTHVEERAIRVILECILVTVCVVWILNIFLFLSKK